MSVRVIKRQKDNIRTERVLLYSACLILILMVSLAYATVRISRFTNMSFGTWNGSSNMSATNDLCVFNSAGTDYSLKAYSDGAFRIKNGTRSIDYEVRFNGTKLDYNSYTAFSGANSISNTCGGGTNATIEVNIPASNISTAAAGPYSGTLFVLVEPG